MCAEAGQRPPQPPCAGQSAVVVHGLAEAIAALAEAGPDGVLLLSARGAAGSLGAGWFLAILAAAATAYPGVPYRAALDCADQPGHALAALRAGARLLVLDPDCPAFAAVAGAAAELGAEVWPVRPAALDLGRLDLRRPGARNKLAAWLRAAG